MSFSERSLLQRRTQNATIALAEYRWDAGDWMRRDEDTHLLVYRLFPDVVSYSAISEWGPCPLGRVALYPADVAVQTSPANAAEHAKSLICRFSPEQLSRFVTTPSALHPDLIQSLNICNDDIRLIVRKISQELLRPAADSDAYLEALSTSLLIELGRFMSQAPPRRLRATDNGFSAADLRAIVHYLEDNIEDVRVAINAEALGERFGISATHFRRLFKQSTGASVQTFLSDLRLSRAKLHLAQGETIKSIAFRLGYRNANAFSTAFRREAGISARDYRSRRH